MDFLSIGTNDLIQYTLAIDRADNAVAHLYDPLHPAVLNLIAFTLREAKRGGVPVSVCGEMAGDPTRHAAVARHGAHRILDASEPVARREAGNPALESEGVESPSRTCCCLRAAELSAALALLRKA